MANHDTNLNPVDLPKLNDVVYRKLREAILRHDFAPGQRLDLAELETRLQVSRTPLKHAMTRLEAEGLVQVLARRGTFVTEISAAKLEEDYKIRSAFELYVALCIYKYLEPADYNFFTDLQTQMDSLATQAKQHSWRKVIKDYLELDRELHMKLVLCGGTPRMVNLWQQTNIHMQVTQLTHKMDETDFETAHFEHRQILDALLIGSPERLYAALLNHLESSRLLMVRISSQE